MSQAASTLQAVEPEGAAGDVFWVHSVVFQSVHTVSLHWPPRHMPVHARVPHVRVLLWQSVLSALTEPALESIRRPNKRGVSRRSGQKKNLLGVCVFV